MREFESPLLRQNKTTLYTRVILFFCSCYTEAMNPGEDNNQNWQQPPEQHAGEPRYDVPPDEVDPQEQPIETDVDYSEEDSIETTSAADVGNDAVVRWQGPEYLEHDRGKQWYILFGVVTLALMAVAAFVIRSWSFVMLIPVMAVALFVYTRRPPMLVDYVVSRKGVHVNDKLYTYDQFRSFSVTSNAGTHSVLLVPRKRFRMGINAYFPEEVGEALVDMLAARLPMQTHTPDSIDKLLAKLRI